MWRTGFFLRKQNLVGLLLALAILPVRARCQDTANLFLKKPTIRPNPIQRAPLIAIAEFECSEKVLATVLVTDGTNSWEQPPTTSAKEKHSIAVMGLRPGRKHQIQVRVQVPGETGTETSDPMEFTTDPLPANFPPIQTLLSKPEKMEPGVTLFAINFWNNSTSILDYGFIIAVNEKGEVVWFCNTRDRIADMRFTKAGTLIYQHGSYRS
ncbi:MAG: aryl-sulfate sulfotransferase N-terminal domain-containing protein, partial [Planctomycetota bacterium]